jgi:hypothetical protein
MTVFSKKENMEIDDDKITCDCGKTFPRASDYRHCTNCFACTGCEIYYCPYCDERIEIKPVKKIDG